MDLSKAPETARATLDAERNKTTTTRNHASEARTSFRDATEGHSEELDYIRSIAASLIAITDMLGQMERQMDRIYGGN
jgi:hypothetical protein